jgi:hypothetical protein
MTGATSGSDGAWPALVAKLADPDPRIRDDEAFMTLATRTGNGTYDGSLRELGATVVAMHRHPEIQARTFATLALGWVIRRDAVTGELDDATVLGWRDAFADWWLGETDVRGWDDGLGWLHALAHGADTARALGRSPRMRAPDLHGLLALVAQRLLIPTDYRFAEMEDQRIAYAVTAVLGRPEVTDPVGWLGPLRDAIDAGEPGPTPVWAANLLGTLAAVTVTVGRGVRFYDPVTQEASEPVVPLAREAVLDAVAQVLRRPAPYLG